MKEIKNDFDELDGNTLESALAVSDEFDEDKS